MEYFKGITVPSLLKGIQDIRLQYVSGRKEMGGKVNSMTSRCVTELDVTFIDMCLHDWYGPLMTGVAMTITFLRDPEQPRRCSVFFPIVSIPSHSALL